MKKTLTNKARSMLSGVGIAQELWVEEVDTEKYLVNMSPSSALVESNQHEVCFGKNPSLSHLKVFGFDAFVHVPKEKEDQARQEGSQMYFIYI
jgi:hypothetical protein